MDPEDLEPRKVSTPLRNLEPMSVEELTRYIGELDAEIARARHAIAQKRDVRAGADALFRK